jgi:hypothetical protein
MVTFSQNTLSTQKLNNNKKKNQHTPIIIIMPAFHTPHTETPEDKVNIIIYFIIILVLTPKIHMIPC